MRLRNYLTLSDNQNEEYDHVMLKCIKKIIIRINSSFFCKCIWPYSVSVQSDWGVTIHPKPCVERLCEGSAVRVQVCKCVCVRGNAVERQRTLHPVQEHSNPAGAGRRCRDVRSLLVVPGCVTVTRAVQFPGFLTGSEHTVTSASFTPDSFITHRDHGFSASPLRLPVTASTQTLSTHHLLPVVEPLRVVRVRLVVYHVRYLSVLLRQSETSVCCVWVQGELTAIWVVKREIRQENICGVCDPFFSIM